jgi:hypothetical protein
MLEDLNAVYKSLANNSSRIVIDKATVTAQVAGGYASMWRSTGFPAQAAIPTAAVVPTKGTLGAMGFDNQAAPVTSYLNWMYAISSNNAQSFEIHDRVAHMGGLVLNITTSQATANMDVLTLGVVADRIGDANYGDLQWWLEVYTAGGATASNATINVTYNDGTTGNLNVLAVGGTLGAGRMLPLIPLIPTAQQGKIIRGINNVILSASTGTAGNFGFTCTRPRTAQATEIANKIQTLNWAQLGAPQIPNDSCLMLVIPCNTTSTGTIRGGGKIAHG